MTCVSLFSMPVHPDLWQLFEFTYQSEKYPLERLPPSFFGNLLVLYRVLAQDQQHLHFSSTVLQCKDNILFHGSTKEQCSPLQS